MDDGTFLDFDHELFELINNYIRDSIADDGSFTINEDQKTFNRYCALRNLFIGFIDNTNRKLKRGDIG